MSLERASRIEPTQNSVAGAVVDALAHARDCLARADDEGAQEAYLAALRLDPTDFEALNDLGVLAHRRGHRSAARTAHRQAVRFHPGNPTGHVNLANILLSEGAASQAREHFLAALAIDADFRAAHQGLARAYEADGDARAGEHWRRGFAGAACERRGHRGIGAAIPVLLLASARLGNMPVEPWLDDRLFDASVIHAEFWDDTAPLPPHALLINLIGDADLCGEALARAQRLVEESSAPAINPPGRARATGRVENARRLSQIPGVVAPDMSLLDRAALASFAEDRFPLLLRAPGFHAGRHFVRVETREGLAAAMARLPGDELLAMSVLDARGGDGLHRKYRVMIIDGALYPLHLAISSNWKVHYFSADMADAPARREEERRFLEAMPQALGPRALAALAGIGEAVGLDYFGVDFALSPDGSLLMFEANAAMAMLDPPPEPIWDYRRKALADAREAARAMAMRRAGARTGLGSLSPCHCREGGNPAS